MRRLLFLLIFVIFAASATPASAFTDKKVFNSYVSSEAYSNNLMGVVGALLQRNRINCGSSSSMARQRPTLLQRVKFNSEKTRPVSGIWLEVITLQGCGSRTTYNFMVQAQESGEPIVNPLVPGNSIIEPVHQAQASKRAMVHAQSMNPECQDLFIAYTLFDRWNQADLTDKRIHRFHEKWYVDVCEKEYEVLIMFTPSEALHGYEIRTDINTDYVRDDAAISSGSDDYDDDYDDSY